MNKQKSEVSTIENPLGFFEYFFIDHGFEEFRDDFHASGDDEFRVPGVGSPDLVMKAKKRILLILGNLNDEFIANRVTHTYENSPDKWNQENAIKIIYFKDALKSKLIYELEISKKFIVKKVKSLALAEGKIVTSLKFVINDLNILILLVKSTKIYLTFSVNLEILYRIVDFIFKQFSVFLTPNDFPIYKEAEAFLFQVEEEKTLIKWEMRKPDQFSELKKIKEDNHALKWISDPELNTTNLYKILTDNSIIPNDHMTIVKFKLAFSGEQLKQSLDIKWSLEKRNSIKTPLIRIIKTLMEELKVIEPMDHAKLAKVLPMIFVNKDGIQPENMIVTLSTGVSPKTGSITERLVIDQLKTTFNW